MEANGVGVGVSRPGAVAAVTSGPSSGGNTPHTIPVTVVSGLPLSRYLQWMFSMTQMEFLPAAGWWAAVSGKPCWPTGHGIHIGHPVGRRLFFIETVAVFCVESTSLRTVFVN